MVAVIGDIHGCLNTLRNLVEQIRQKYPSIEIFSVGDLVDRGNFSYEVIEFIKSEKIKFTAGNHDYMMYYFIKHPLYYNLDECLISHAGISKYMKNLLPNDFEVNSSELDEVVHSNINSEDGILWTRGTLLNIGKLQVVGHTIKKDVIYSEKSNAIYIDTGVYLGNKLSAVIVENGKLIEVLQEKTHHNDIRPNY